MESRATFEDSQPEDVIRRLLDRTEVDRTKGTTTDQGADLVSKGGRIPHGSELRMRYKGKEYHAVVEDGKIVWEGRTFGSPSEAAVAVVRSAGSDRARVNGWEYWEVKTPESGEWRVADNLRSNGDPDEAEKEELLGKIEALSEEQREKVKAELVAEGVIDDGVDDSTG